MAIPPERITIKRRRDDEPVDTLYIEQKRQRSNYVWSRVDSGKTSAGNTSPLPQLLSPSASTYQDKNNAETCIPAVEASLPNDATRSQNSASHQSLRQSNTDVLNTIFAAPLPSVVSESALSPNVESNSRKIQSLPDHVSQPRTFHLSTSLTSASTKHDARTSRVYKSRKHRNDVAVFIEKTKRNPRIQDALKKAVNTSSRLIHIQDNKDQEFEERGYPINDAIDRTDIKVISPGDAANSQSNSGQDIDKPASQSDPDPTIHAGQLHRSAMKEPTTYTQISASTHHAHPKIKPKPPRPRPGGRQVVSADSSGDERMENTETLEEEDFVYDTYIRSSGQLASVPVQLSEPSNNGLGHIETRKIGILIITEQDEAVWEAFGEEEESDRDWDSDEEDENAENFYGNDYPEDELDSDDEFGMGAYDYRTRTSDDEDYDKDIAHWSDEEEAARHPWKHHVVWDGDSDHENGNQ